jgi:hypothetical protein
MRRAPSLAMFLFAATLYATAPRHLWHGHYTIPPTEAL